MFGKKKRKQEDATNVTRAGVAPTAELSDDNLESVVGGMSAEEAFDRMFKPDGKGYYDGPLGKYARISCPNCGWQTMVPARGGGYTRCGDCGNVFV